MFSASNLSTSLIIFGPQGFIFNDIFLNPGIYFQKTKVKSLAGTAR